MRRCCDAIFFRQFALTILPSAFRKKKKGKHAIGEGPGFLQEGCVRCARVRTWIAAADIVELSGPIVGALLSGSTVSDAR